MDADAKTKTCYEKKKPSIYKWRENNKEKYNIICNKAQAIYYVKNKEKISQRKKEWYAHYDRTRSGAFYTFDVAKLKTFYKMNNLVEVEETEETY